MFDIAFLATGDMLKLAVAVTFYILGAGCLHASLGVLSGADRLS